ncbi:18044_t:CDS:2, partial [Racocetra persica]
MVGYPESLTDPSYQGQILVLTFPLVGNYGVPSRDDMEPLLKDIPKYFESCEIHITGLVVGQYSREYSHHLAQSSLADWLKEHDIPAIYGIDTRALTKKIRTQGVLLGKILFPKSVVGNAALGISTSNDLSIDGLVYPEPWMADYQDVPWVDPNERNLVAEVSIKEPKIYTPDPSIAITDAKGMTLRIVAIDVGMKYNQIRCFVNRGVEFKVVPWDYDFNNEKDYHGLFIRQANGPGDPTMVKQTVERLKVALKEVKTPIFG